jgi:hypothetical protein
MADQHTDTSVLALTDFEHRIRQLVQDEVGKAILEERNTLNVTSLKIYNCYKDKVFTLKDKLPAAKEINTTNEVKVAPLEHQFDNLREHVRSQVLAKLRRKTPNVVRSLAGTMVEEVDDRRTTMLARTISTRTSS